MCRNFEKTAKFLENTKKKGKIKRKMLNKTQLFANFYKNFRETSY